MARQSTGKRLRFEVFHRDQFTCRYCGGQPPAVLLVLDHVVPVAKGGSTTVDNLVTACEPCNQGKADKPLIQAGPRPDADLLYLSTRQEILEIRRYQESLREREAAYQEAVAALQEVWCQASGLDWHPSGPVIRKLLQRYPVEVVSEAMMDVACKVGTGYLSSYGQKWVRYLYAVARNLAQEAEGPEEDG